MTLEIHTCRDAEQTSEYESDCYIRCPKCGEREGDLWERSFSDGNNGVFCGSCGHEYEVSVRFSVSYTSPALEEPV